MKIREEILNLFCRYYAEDDVGDSTYLVPLKTVLILSSQSRPAFSLFDCSVPHHADVLATNGAMDEPDNYSWFGNDLNCASHSP